jgi:hypothetical protein
MKYRKLMSLAILVALWPCWVGRAKGALGNKVVDVDYLVTKFDAVTISKITVAGQQIQPGLSSGPREDKSGKPFEEDEDWLNKMSIFLTNQTDKVIVCAEVELWFPEIGDGSLGHPSTMYKITVGERPEWSIYYRDGTKIQPDPDRKLLFLAPGETVEVPVADYLVAIRDRIEEKMLFSKVSRVTLSRHNFYFADGMRWDANSRGYYVPETGRPGHYTKLAEDFFPGRPSVPEKLAQNAKSE